MSSFRPGDKIVVTALNDAWFNYHGTVSHIGNLGRVWVRINTPTTRTMAPIAFEPRELQHTESAIDRLGNISRDC